MKRELLYVSTIFILSTAVCFQCSWLNTLEDRISLLELSRINARDHISELQQAHKEDSNKIKELEKRADDTDKYDLLEIDTLDTILDYIQKQENPSSFDSPHPQTISL